MLPLQTDMMPGLNPVAAPDSTMVSSSHNLAELKSLSLEDLIDRLARSAVDFAVNLAVAIIVFYIGRFIIRKIYKLLSTIFLRRRVDKSLSTFVLSLVNIVLYFILIVTVIGILGIETTSFLAIFASAGVAIGMALSGTLQNFAGGVLILLLKPYKIGDYIEVQGYAGTVREIQIFHTIITTYDNKSISIPNGGLSTGSVNNWSREAFRRVTWTVAISYGDNVADVRRAIMQMFAADTRIEQDASAGTSAGVELVGEEENLSHHTNSGDTVEFHPDDEEETVDVNEDVTDGSSDGAAGANPPRRSLWDRIMHRHRRAKALLQEREEKRRRELMRLVPKPDRSPKVLVKELADSSVNIEVRAWTRTADYWNVYYYYNEKFYNELPRCGVSFPFPQLDVHLDKA